MTPIYNTAIALYSLAAKAVALKSNKVKTMLRGQRETITRLRSLIKPEDRPVWIHAASLGEFEQGRPIIERLRRECPEKKIVLSFFSPSGYEVRKNYDKVDAVVYLPFDTPTNARALIDAINPSVAIFVKYEFWGNYLQELHKREIPTYIISAIFRPKQIFFRPWGGVMRKVLRFFNRLYVQDDNSMKLLDSIGIKNVTIAGDTRFDRVTDVMNSVCSVPGIEKFNKGRGADVIFGSSWQADEEKYIPWLNANQNVSFIIAPHEFDEDRLKKLRDSLRGNVVLLSQWEKMFSNTEQSPRQTNPSSIRGIIVDSFGKLSALYRYARVAYIGGGFGVSIHNINEAAVYGIPVVFGPKFQKFKEATDLIALGGATACYNKEDVEAALNRFVNDSSEVRKTGDICREYIVRNLGATDIIFNDLFKDSKDCR